MSLACLRRNFASSGSAGLMPGGRVLSICSTQKRYTLVLQKYPNTGTHPSFSKRGRLPGNSPLHKAQMACSVHTRQGPYKFANSFLFAELAAGVSEEGAAASRHPLSQASATWKQPSTTSCCDTAEMASTACMPPMSAWVGSEVEAC